MTKFRPYAPGQLLLLPTNLNDWIGEGHLALFISDTIDALDLGEIFADYVHETERGNLAYHPAMMLKVLVYGYCVGVMSSRKIEKACWDDVAFRVLSADQHPDFQSIARFRRRHLKALPNLFKQVLRLAQEAGLVKLGLIALDGTKIKANASKHKAMSYERLVENEARLKKVQEEADKELKALGDDRDKIRFEYNQYLITSKNQASVATPVPTPAPEVAPASPAVPPAPVPTVAAPVTPVPVAANEEAAIATKKISI